jgi:alkanesulfonate monooxygenase SsuD/methylene tetrahydromethanopterin reductase-like flavin-dependent oxidoreductase (luciferase family)
MTSGLKFGLHLHPERGVDAVLAEAQAADAQGYDSVWLADHLMREPEDPDGGLDSFTLMTAIAATTQHVRFAWGALNPSFRKPAILAKMLATLDRISHGRVICSLGAGSDKSEYPPYELEWIDDHDARIAHGREVALALKQLWTHPAPERVTIDGTYVKIHNIAFNPTPYQQPHPPIWAGGNSEATQALVKEYADGWMLLSRGNPREVIAKAQSAPDWPTRPLEIVGPAQVIAADTAEAANDLARSMFEVAPGRVREAGFEAYVAGAIVGTPETCAAALLERKSWGMTYLRVTFPDAAQQEYFGTQVLPLVAEAEAAAPV